MVKQAIIDLLIEQIRARDKLISDFRAYLTDWDMSIPEHVPDSLYEQWETEQKRLIATANELVPPTIK